MAETTKQKICNEWQYFEALDRAHIVQMHLDAALGDHPAIKNHPDLKKLYRQASDTLGELYILISQYSF